MERQYTIYRITSPSGKMYIGYTGMRLADRWHCHKARAKSGAAPRHPFYNEIREYGPERFSVEAIDSADSYSKALLAERNHIALCPLNLRLNLSPGGWDDASFGRELFWEYMNAHPDEKRAYLQKLSDRKRAADWSDYEEMSKRAAQWRTEHPREAYKQVCRASRLSRKGKNHTATPHIETQEERKKRLMWKYKRGDVIHLNMTEMWRKRSDEEKTAIVAKISKAAKTRMAEITDPEKRSTITEKARAAIDRKKQGQAASQGLKRYWIELRKDPQAYQDYINRRKQAAIEAAKNRVVKQTSLEERRAMTEKARAAIDRQKQQQAASRGLRRYWEELRKDPQAYQDYNNRRKQSMMKTLKAKKREKVDE